MSKRLNVIALISGGKDSLYTLLHCIQNGHRVVALANLYPTPAEDADADADAIENEDLNSFMYQTVGHKVIPLYEDALQLPLYRQHITGSSSQTGRYYDSSIKESRLDETEDLVPLLESVKKHHPEADALCSGAILSTYQRTRIESVALRLGLTPLAYLWQYPVLPPPSARLDSLIGLLEDMNAAGCDSRIIKIASGGMPDDLLGSNITDQGTMTRIVASMAPFFEGDEPALRGAVLGEGGEFETLAIDGPRSIWKSRIEIVEDYNLAVSEEGGVKWLRLGKTRVLEQETEMGKKASNDLVRVPSTLDPQFGHIAALPWTVPNDSGVAFQGVKEMTQDTVLFYEALKRVDVKLSLGSRTLSLANIMAPNLPGNAAQQMEHIVSHLKKTLLHISEANNIDPPLSTAAIISTTLLLDSMSSFPFVNTSYAELFPPGLPNPPARVTIASSLPQTVLVSLSCIISLLPRNTHRGLHVQSRSYWTPANIGPYSQAICVPFNASDSDGNHRCEFVHVAGQIPLTPASMEILRAPFVDQTVLALQHLWRVGQERGVDLWTWGVAYLPHLDEVESKRLPHIAMEVWKQAHLKTVQGKPVLSEDNDEEDTDEPGPDAWDIRHNRMGAGRVIPTVGKHRHVLPNAAALANLTDRLWVPPTIVAEVTELPRSAPVEWHSHGLGGLPKYPGSTSRVTMNSHSFPWGTVGVCSYNSAKDNHRDDIDDRGHPTAQEIRRDHHFLTVQVLRTAETGKIPTISEVLERVLPSRYARLSQSEAGHEEEGADTAGKEKHRSCVHGITYVSCVGGRAALTALGGIEAMGGIAIIPCRQLWGECHQPKSSGGGEAGLMDLSLALTLRIDIAAASV